MKQTYGGDNEGGRPCVLKLKSEVSTSTLEASFTYVVQGACRNNHDVARLYGLLLCDMGMCQCGPNFSWVFSYTLAVDDGAGSAREEVEVLVNSVCFLCSHERI